MASIILHLHCEGMVGVDHDATQDYIAATGWTAPAGVTYDGVAQTLAGDASECYAAFRALRESVARVGHGTDMDGGPIDADPPSLTACPAHLIADGWTCAAESLARLESTDAATWAEYAARLPAAD